MIEEKLILALKKERVLKMLNPIILMNEDDFTEFEIYLKSNVVGLYLSKKPTFQGVPISFGPQIEKGFIYICEDPEKQ